MAGYPDRPVWFEHGLTFGCTGCGACCTGAPGRVLVTDDEILAISVHLGTSEENFRRNHLRVDEGGWSLLEREGGDCEFLLAGRCTLQPVKPRQCRTYPFWLGNIRSPEAWLGAAAACPGIGLGRTYSRSEILAMAMDGVGAAVGVAG